MSEGANHRIAEDELSCVLDKEDDTPFDGQCICAPSKVLLK